MQCRRLRRACLVLACLAVTASLALTACAPDPQSAGPAVQLITSPSPTASATQGPGVAAAEPAGPQGIIAFPPRNEPYQFRQDLEVRYRDVMGRQPSATYVDLEGDIVWTQEYVRYRVNQCDHATAVQKVFDQIDGRGVQPVCGDPTAGGPVAFPPRNEPYAFRQALEAKYRDGLRRAATASSVDIEGAIVWTQEYLRYRVNRCGHAAATSKVMNQIAGLGIAPTCWDALSGTWDGTSTYFNAPFTMELWLSDTRISGRYEDRHDIGYIGGTYSGGNAVVIDVNFGDTGIRFSGAFDGPERIRGTIRGGVIGGTYPFEMTRRPAS